MTESEDRPERIPSSATGRHSHRRRARKRRAGESSGAFSDGTLEHQATRALSVVIGAILIFGQLVLTRMVFPSQLVRAIFVVLGMAALSLLIVWFEQQRSKKRNPKPRWLRGILIAGFLGMSVVLGSLLVLNMSANPIEDSSFSAGEAGTFSTRTHFEAKTLQLKLLVFHILATAGGMALLAYAIGPEKHRRNEPHRQAPATSAPPAPR